MRRAVALGFLAAVVLPACGGSPGIAEGPAAPAPGGQVAAQVVPKRPTAEQLAYRDQLLQQLKDGTYVPCTCTSELRAKERMARGKATSSSLDATASAAPDD